MHSEKAGLKDEKLPSLEELKKQKAEVEELLAKLNEQLKVREKEMENGLQK